ncbi:MAG TPA: xanthine dehydrogenase small subunit [Thermohalobaculum sp.]|nr:xanthine dehydrogenase small subunit [Thermohalobaculum sp.]
MGRPIRFILNGETVEISNLPPNTTLLNWLRYQRCLTGTKEGCAEGDCGACTVAIRALDADGQMVTKPVNACIQLLPMLHGTEVVTVERLASPEGALHPVQAALSECHGSQCGFCTPGFVMSMWTAYHSEGKPDLARTNDLLAGNLCRCTGYGPIIKATAEAYDRPRAAWDDADAKAAAGRLAALGANQGLDYAAGGKRFWAPVTLDAFAALVEAHPGATILSGATDVGLWVTKHAFDPAEVIYTGRVAELREMHEAGGQLWIGAGVTYRAARARIAGLYPDFGELIRRIGATQVRAAGTIGGNIANGSPIGDTPPALIAASAALVLRKGAARREMALEDYYIEYGKQDRRPGEFVEGVRLAVPADGGRLGCYKLSKRFDQDITAVLGCFDVAVEGGNVRAARLAYGGMAGVPKRATHAEAALVGKPWDAATVRAAMAALERDFTPLSDMRASAAYRMQGAKNILMKYFIEKTEPATATRLVGAGTGAA